MLRDATNTLYSATDLVNFLGCAHCTALDLRCRDGQLAPPPAADDAYRTLLAEKGLEHERGFLNRLRSDGRSVRAIDHDGPRDTMAEATRQALRDGVDVIYQGALTASPWLGYSDFLLKVERPSLLGDYSYEVLDTKLARSPRPKHVIQLALYSELLAREQGVPPEHAHLLLGDGARVALRLAEYVFYFGTARDRFLEFVSSPGQLTTAEPCEHCELCRWSPRCEHEWNAADHLSLVARINRAQRRQLAAAGLTTLTALAELGESTRVPRLQPETLHRLQAQAKLQLNKRTTGENRFELLPPAPRRGFGRLPQPNAGDLFFDMEGDPIYSSDGSLEYLFGFHSVDDGHDVYTAFWANDRASEKTAFEHALDFMTARLAAFPNAYIYHYASYEEVALRRLAQKYGAAPPAPVAADDQTGALKRLAQHYGTRENEVDDLLRGRKLVDLYKVVREGVRVSQRSYSLKDLEIFFAPDRTQRITSGGESVVAFERWLALRDQALLDDIAAYNAFDCTSTRLCRDWLLGIRPPDVEWFDPAAVAEEDAEKEAERERKRRENDVRITALRADLMRDAPNDERPWRELLGYLLEYHRREARREWWNYFERLNDKSREQLIEDTDCLGGLVVDGSIAPRRDKRSTVWTLSFPEQDTKLKAGSKAVRVDTGEHLEIVALDERNRRLELKLGPSRARLADEIALIPGGPLDDKVQREAIVRFAERVIAGRADETGAVTSIVRRDKPRIRDRTHIQPAAGELLSGTSDAVRRMDRTHLLVQGPPGSGKTFTSAHAIVDRLEAGERVGVMSLSHKAINNLLWRVETVALERGFTFAGVKKRSKEDQAFNGSIIEDTDDNDVVIEGDHQLVAGTAWLFSRPELHGRFDYLFVDEAGQLSLATVVASGSCARNVVLIGDQMQLSQPVKGVHPGGSGVSVMDHLMAADATVPPDRGIFLDRTWRMHPALCRFVSDTFYDSRLQSVDSAARQKVIVSSDVDAAIAPFGLRFVAVSHQDNAQKSVEEAERLCAVYRDLIGLAWIDRDGVEKPIGVDDILVVSPYNMQVNLLRGVLPDGACIGTVDKFQGQEAAIVLVSMAASNGERIPRGIEFLFSPNRLNVAISRARCLAVVFASPRLLETACRSIEQLRLVNTMCRMTAASHAMRADVSHDDGPSTKD